MTKPLSISRLRNFCTSTINSISQSESHRISTPSTFQNILTGDASTVARGTAFEHSSSLLLNRRFGIQLQRVGGAGDGGIDLSGWWYIPSDVKHQERVQKGEISKKEEQNGRRKRLRVIAQCKAEAKKLGPVIIREFEGTLHRAQLQDRLSRNSFSSSSTTTHQESDSANGNGNGTEMNESHPLTDSRMIGILLSSSGFSKQSAIQALSSPNPLLLIHLEAPNLNLHSDLINHFEKQNSTFINDSKSDSDSINPEEKIKAVKISTSSSIKTRKKKLLKSDENEKGEKSRNEDQILSYLETPTCFSAMANQVLLSKNGPLQGRMEIRWERVTNSKEKLLEGDGRPILYWDGKRLEEKDVVNVFGISM